MAKESKKQDAPAEVPDVDLEQAGEGFRRSMMGYFQCVAAYEYFNALVNGEVKPSPITTTTTSVGLDGRPVIVKIDLQEILDAEVPEEDHATALQQMFAVINNYYARKVSECAEKVLQFGQVVVPRMKAALQDSN